MKLRNYKLYRRLVGGLWVKMNSNWLKARWAYSFLGDKEYIRDEAHGSYHRQFAGIQALEDYT